MVPTAWPAPGRITEFDNWRRNVRLGWIWFAVTAPSRSGCSGRAENQRSVCCRIIAGSGGGAVRRGESTVTAGCCGERMTLKTALVTPTSLPHQNVAHEQGVLGAELPDGRQSGSSGGHNLPVVGRGGREQRQAHWCCGAALKLRRAGSGWCRNKHHRSAAAAGTADADFIEVNVKIVSPAHNEGETDRLSGKGR